MLRLQRTENRPGSAVSTRALMPLEQRIKSRVRITLEDGRDAGVFLERGDSLKDGDLLASDSGEIIAVVAAAETVSECRCDDSLMLARACYHLGNRHVPLQIGDGFVRYLHDHVLDDMLRGFGLSVDVTEKPFEPEPGAYGGRSGGHSHSHGHGHHHHHGDDHGHSH
ncbi:urease accessory protein UreE [Granulosicoccaceae sp. 1_MG-2023]|nr:urease accessory protein UreE [Granulosicoccaceae sp. 1_MG-2023]